MLVTHGVRRPPRHIERALRRINPNLRIRWRDDVSRWVLYELGRYSRRLFPVRVIEDTANGNSYEELSWEVVKKAALGDSWRRTCGGDSILDEVQRRNDELDEREAAKTRDACHEAAVDLRRYATDKKTIDLSRPAR